MKQMINEEELAHMREVIGANVLSYRRENGWTQEELAEKLMYAGLSDISLNTISCIENGRTLPLLPTLYYLSVAFGCSFDDLTNGI